eukprot:CAMPEP_0181114848 /NCGR_PEP_ID=MMETSP1071-20121207/21121_1 /TAXON_ID=35127 /ORGANISM="Thalassiosira sp., Strain NH16" /LENGTH=590 /DNA_ID=CAMNT_0023199023 /DNA_START=119 /DNA_END=1891 /DNA_ORIENTATION=+
MGYNSSRQNELKLVEEKKDDSSGDGNENQDVKHPTKRRVVDVDAKQLQLQQHPPSPRSSVGDTGSGSYSNPEESNDAFAVAASTNGPSSSLDDIVMQQDPEDPMQRHGNQPVLGLNEMQQMQALGSLQLNAPNAAGAVLAPVPPFTGLITGPAMAAAMSMLSPVAVVPQAELRQQRALAQQQVAAQVAALSIGSVTSAQTAVAPSVGVAARPPSGVVLSPFTPIAANQAVSPLGLDPMASLLAAASADPIASAPLLAATADPTVVAAPLLAANPLAATANHATTVPVLPTTAALSGAVAAPTHHSHHLSPQLTIPHYVPPIPPKWGAQIPALSVQDRPLVPPVYNGINPNYPGAQLLHAHPPIFAVENFLTPAECDFLIDAAQDAFGPAPVVGKGSGEFSASRTSSTCYLAREDLPEYLRKVGMLTGKPREHFELPQVGRYYPSQQYLQHFDAFDLSNDDGRRFAANGGQRTVTVLVYLNDVPRGGATSFPNLNIEVQPRRGMALVFFPSTLDGLLDKMALHAALPAVDVKYVSQVWIRQSNYEGRPSKRLAEPMMAGLQERREAVQKILMQQQMLHAQAQTLHQFQNQQ